MKVSRSTRSILITALGVGLVCSLPAVSMARVSGICSNCHSMHASQESALDQVASWSASTLAGVAASGLLVNDCIGCHQDLQNDRLTPIGAPAVVTATGAQDVDTLPGGFFAITPDDESNQHSIVAIGSDADLTIPPGWDAGQSTRTTTGWTASTLTCAGTQGCHGNVQQPLEGAAVSGIHHKATALGYRGLVGISGVESPTYQTKYNGYSGINKPGGTGQDNTISSLCGQCHSKFHDRGTESNVLSGTAWIRHPTDYALKSGNMANDNYLAYNNAAYDPEVVVADNYATGVMDITVGDDGADYKYWPADGNQIVICLSCHRAHGSSHRDLLRWTYENMEAATATAGIVDTGCFRCHESKDSSGN